MWILLGLSWAICKVQAASEVIYLENKEARLGIDLWGGSFVEFKLKDSGVNPLSWKLTAAQMPANNQAGAPFAGHFLCLGRWGQPTEGEMAAGLPHNGQATNTLWTLGGAKSNALKMHNEAPMDGMHVERHVKLDADQPLFYVTESVTNTTSVGRLNNIVQHVTVGPPFLSKQTIIDSNADEGFLQKQSYPDPHAHAYHWPTAYSVEERQVIDLRSSDTPINYVSTHIYRDPYGWITALSPENGLLLGYLWKTDEYPWANIWHHNEDGQPVAKGLEFGTTGIGRPYQDLLATDTRFHGVSSFHFLDAGETLKKSFAAFLIEVPEGTKGVRSIEVVPNKQLIITLIHTDGNITQTLNFKSI